MQQMTAQEKQSTEPASGYLIKTIAIMPLLVLPVLVHLRHFGFIAPNEEPKWLLIFILITVVSLIFGWQVWKQKSTYARPGVAGWLLIAFLIWLGIGVSFGPNWVEGLIRFDFWFSCALIWLISLYATRELPDYQHWLSWSVIATAVGFSIHYAWNYFDNFSVPGFTGEVTFSPIGHINFTGDALIILLPMLAFIAITYSKQLPILLLSLFSITSITLVLLIASSRGSLGGLILGLAATALIGGRHLIAGGWQRYAKWLAAIGVLVVVLNTLYSALPSHFRELGRLSDTAHALLSAPPMQLTPHAIQPPQAEMWASLQPFLTTRTPILASSWAMVLDRPWTGHGTGSFTYIYPAYSNHFPDFRDPFSTPELFIDNPHNIVFQLMCDNGIPATLAFMGLLLWFWWRCLIRLWQVGDAISATAFSALTAVLFDSMFNHIFVNPVSMYLFALLGGFWYAHHVKADSTHHAITLPDLLSRSVAIVVPAAVVLLLIWPGRWLISQWHHTHAMHHLNQPALMEQRLLKAYQADPYNPRPIFDLSQLYLRQKKADQALPLLQRLNRIQPYCAPARNLLGIAYAYHREPQKAYNSFIRSLQVIPDYALARKNLLQMQKSMVRPH